jgi:rhamnose utilization protein RhaD (predicted bifunctional aldolase and dehydrogenase)
MKNLWKKSESLKYINYYKKNNVSQDLALRIYTTHLLGGEKKLVLHGGGNTSVKTNFKNIFGRDQKVIYVKGSGWDMSNLTHKGMPGLNIDPLLTSLSLKKLNDENMVNFLRSNLIDSNSPNPSVETLLHAYLPHKFVDHTHSNAFLSLVNLKNSKEICKKLFGNRLGIVPYVMPGFDLAKLCHKIYNLNPNVEGLILLNHGIFTFGDTAKKSYDRMIKNVTILEKFIAKNKINIKFINPTKAYRLGDLSLSIRKKYTEIDGNKWIVKFHNEKKDIEFTLRKDLKELFSKGPVTPDHVIRIKSKPLVLKYTDINKTL